MKKSLISKRPGTWQGTNRLTTMSWYKMITSYLNHDAKERAV